MASKAFKRHAGHDPGRKNGSRGLAGRYVLTGGSWSPSARSDGRGLTWTGQVGMIEARRRRRPMTTRLPPPQDGEPFVAKLEQAIEEGDADFIEANLPALERLIARLQTRAHEIAEMQHRARVIRDRHEPPAEKRIRQQR